MAAKGTIPVMSGDKVKLQWDQWGSSHSGPVMNYLADCGGSCEGFKGDTGTLLFLNTHAQEPPG
jgi:cellulase